MRCALLRALGYYYKFHELKFDKFYNPDKFDKFDSGFVNTPPYWPSAAARFMILGVHDRQVVVFEAWR
jgi:hypothetical protein